MEGLVRLAAEAQSPNVPSCQVLQAIFEGDRSFAGGRFHDDVCLLIGRRKAAIPGVPA
jgi:hypothetical protein